MKITTQKLLLFLSLDLAEPVTYDYLTYLWPELTPSGRRSLIAKLNSQGLIRKKSLGSSLSFELTRYGQEMVWEEFPFLKETVDMPDSHYLILLKYPATDLYFRQLRTLLRQAKLIPLTSSVYWAKQGLPSSLISVLRKKYFSSVAYFRGGEWEIGDPELFLSTFFSFTELNSSLSGISNHTIELINKKNSFSTSNHQSKIAIFSVYDRIFALFKEWKKVQIDLSTPSTSGKMLLKQFSQLF